jgi:hypothetical protein
MYPSFNPVYDSALSRPWRAMLPGKESSVYSIALASSRESRYVLHIKRSSPTFLFHLPPLLALALSPVYPSSSPVHSLSQLLTHRTLRVPAEARGSIRGDGVFGVPSRTVQGLD